MKTRTLVTIPNSIAKMGELVVLPRKEFEKLLEGKMEKLEEQELLRLSREAKNLKKEDRLSVLLSLRDLREFSPTVSQKKALLLAEKNLKSKKTLSYNELVRKLGFTS